MTDHPALDRAIDEAAETYGRLDVAFANAGIDPGPDFVGAWAGDSRPRKEEGALERYTDERWNRVVDINLNGSSPPCARPRGTCAHRVGSNHRHHISQRDEGRAGDRLRVHGREGGRRPLHALRRARTGGLRDHGQRDRAGLPRDEHRRRARPQPELQAAVAKDIPMHRVGQPNDIKGLALFLASPASAYITGRRSS